MRGHGFLRGLTNVRDGDRAPRLLAVELKDDIADSTSQEVDEDAPQQAHVRA
jgi:hypothetical protein